MKQFTILAVALLSALGTRAQNVGDTVTMNGTKYLVGSNLITNSSFDNGLTGWTNGTSNATTLNELTSAGGFAVNADGGVDGNWLSATSSTGVSGTGSVKTFWKLDTGSMYYFSCYVSNLSKQVSPNTDYLVVSLTSTPGTEEVKLVGNGSNAGEFGAMNVSAGTDKWTRTEILFDNSASGHQKDYLQCMFRWLGGGYGFDKFYLAKVYDVNKVTPVDLIRLQFEQVKNDFITYETESDMISLPGLAIALSDYEEELENVDDTNIDDMKASIAKMQQLMVEAKGGVTNSVALSALIESVTTELEKTNYPGSEDLEKVIEDATNIVTDVEATTATGYSAALTNLKSALLKYRLSQNASADTPADYSFFISSPSFSSSGTESASSKYVGTWINGSTYTGGDQRLNFTQNHTCWNAWWNVSTADAGIKILDIHQTLSGLPNGMYSISCLAMTQDGCLSDQHAYAVSSVASAVSPNMTIAGWNNSDATLGVWDSLTTAKVLVSDGTMTIGFTSSKTGTSDTNYSSDNREGWWCATHFSLHFYGTASDDDIKKIYDESVSSVTAMADTMHLAADKKNLIDTISLVSGASTVAEMENSLAILTRAQALAAKSEAVYADMMNKNLSRMIPILSDSISSAGDNAYGSANAIAKYTLDKVNSYIRSTDATYTLIPSLVDKVTSYVSSYIPVFNAVSDSLSKMKSQIAITALKSVIDNQKNAILKSDSLLGATVIISYISELNNTQRCAYAQNIYAEYPNNSDYSFMIRNADTGGTTANDDGWNIDKGNGNGPLSTGQYYDGTKHYYFDSYNSVVGKLNNFNARQVISGLPNGTYTLKVDARTDASKGIFMYATANDIDTVMSRIELYGHVLANGSSTSNDTTVYVGNKYGKIWEKALDAVTTGTYTDMQLNISNQNNGDGWGWNQYTLDVKVENHILTIGVSTDSLITKETFNGLWLSFVNFSLTKIADGDNSGWNGPISGVTSVPDNNSPVIEYYNVNGIRMNSTAKLTKGMYIVRQNGKTKKILKR